jgi:hypothetical protein
VYDVSAMLPLFTDITVARRGVFFISRPLHEQLSVICDVIRYYSITDVTIYSLCISEPLSAALAPISTTTPVAAIAPSHSDYGDDDNDNNEHDDSKVNANDVTQYDLAEAAATEAAFEGLKARIPTNNSGDNKDNKTADNSSILASLADSISVRVQHLPLPYMTTCMGANTFLLPSSSPAFPLLAPATPNDDAPIPHLDKDDSRYLLRQRLMVNTRSLPFAMNVAYSDITPFIPVQSAHLTSLSSSSSAYSHTTSMTILSSSLCSLCQSLAVRPSIFSIGQSSRTVAQQFMTAWADHEKLNPPAVDVKSPTTASSPTTPSSPSSSNNCSFVIIDRTLDLVPPMLHSECLLDRMYRVLPSYTPWNGTIDISIQSTLTPRVSPSAPPLSSSSSGSGSIDESSIEALDALSSAVHDREGSRIIQSLTMQFATTALVSLRRACAAVTSTEIKKDVSYST